MNTDSHMPVLGMTMLCVLSSDQFVAPNYRILLADVKWSILYQMHPSNKGVLL